MDAQERARTVETEMKLLWSENRVDEIVSFFAEQIRQAEQAAREGALEEAAVWHEKQASEFMGDEHDRSSRREIARRVHVFSYDEIRALKDKP